MPLSEEQLDALRFYPTLATDPVDQELVGQLHDEFIQRTGGLPYSFAAYAGQVLAVRSDGSRPDVAGRLTEPIGFGNAQVRDFEPYPVAVTTNTTITAALHAGARLVCTNVGAISLNLSLTTDPLSGIQNNFACQIARSKTAGTVQLVLGGTMINGHPNNHLKIAAGRIIEVYLFPATTELGIYGGTEA